MHSLTRKLITNICRTCMGGEESERFTTSQKDALISVFHKAQESTFSNITVMDILKQSMPQLSIESDDLLPKNVCKNCLEQLVNIYEFQQKCLVVENKLRNLLKQCSDISNMADKSTDDPLTDDRTEETLNDWRSIIKLEIDEPLIDTTSKHCVSNTIVEYLISNESGNRSDDDVKGDLCDTPPNQLTPRPMCHGKPATPKILRSSIRSVHWNNDDREAKDFECQQCGSRLKTLKSLRRHEKIHLQASAVGAELTNLSQEFHFENDSEDQNEYAECSTNTNKSEIRIEDNQNDIEQIQITNKDPHEVILLTCNECGCRFKTGLDLKRHLKIHLRSSDKKSEQSQCMEGWHNDSEESIERPETMILENRNQEKSGQIIIVCDETPEEGDTKIEEDIQQLIVEPQLEQDKNIEVKHYICDECGRQLKTRKSLKRHKRIHLRLPENKTDRPKPSHVCEYCQKEFCQSSSLKDHLRVHTGEQPYLCSECGKAFTSLSNMKQHFLRHGTARPYECPDCPKRFPCHSDLASHKAVHNKTKPHVCDICGASFVKPYLLKKHKMYHTGEKNHKCDYCDMRFVLADQCRRHMRTHTGEKPYKCKYCVRAFAQSNDLIKHLRGHLGDNVYKCDLCPQGFRLQGELRTHFNTHKNDDEQTKLKNLQAHVEDELRLQLKFSVK